MGKFIMIEVSPAAAVLALEMLCKTLVMLKHNPQEWARIPNDPFQLFSAVLECSEAHIKGESEPEQSDPPISKEDFDKSVDAMQELLKKVKS